MSIKYFYKNHNGLPIGIDLLLIWIKGEQYNISYLFNFKMKN